MVLSGASNPVSERCTTSVLLWYLWTEYLCSLKFMCWNSKPSSMMVFGGVDFGKQFILNEVMRVGSSSWEQHPYKKRHQRACFLSLPCEDTGIGQACQERTKWASTLILDLPTSRAVRKWITVVQATQSVLFCCGSSNRLMNKWCSKLKETGVK